MKEEKATPVLQPAYWNRGNEHFWSEMMEHTVPMYSNCTYMQIVVHDLK